MWASKADEWRNEVFKEDDAGRTEEFVFWSREGCAQEVRGSAQMGGRHR